MKTFFPFSLDSLLPRLSYLLIDRRSVFLASGLMRKKNFHFLHCNYRLGCDSKLLSQFIRPYFVRGLWKFISKLFLFQLVFITFKVSLSIQNDLIDIQVLNLSLF